MNKKLMLNVMIKTEHMGKKQIDAKETMKATKITQNYNKQCDDLIYSHFMLNVSVSLSQTVHKWTPVITLCDFIVIYCNFETILL